MKKTLHAILPAILLMTFLGGSALAQNKIATVDMRKLFDNYYKTKQAQAIIQDIVTGYVKDEKALNDEVKKDSDEYQQLLTQAGDPAISADERDRRKQSAADKLKQLQDRKAEIDQYERTAQATLSDKRQQMSGKIMAEIQAVVNTKAKADGYEIVLNTAAEGINLGTANINVPSSVVYSAREIDLTADVLKQLNAGAPIDTTAPAVTTPTTPLIDTHSP
jgi:outer membrane protein